jgi:hypothetical protein
VSKEKEGGFVQDCLFHVFRRRKELEEQYKEQYKDLHEQLHSDRTLLQGWLMLTLDLEQDLNW